VKRRITMLSLVAFALAAAALIATSRQPRAASPVAAAKAEPDPISFACQGRVEAGADPVEVSASIDGVIRTLLVSEGQFVRKGQLLARVSCDDLDANTQAQRAVVESARQALMRLHRGSRDEERLTAAEATNEARAVRDHAEVQFDRMDRLYKTEDISLQTLDNARRDWDVAEAALRKADQQERLVLAPPLAEDVSRLEAELAGAEARLRSAEASFAKCAVESPVNGTVIKVLRKVGESVSTFTPQPIATVGDLTIRRVRAEVDERDVAKVFIGQTAVVRIEDDELTGRVTRTALRMGRKSIQGVVPGDKNDRDVLDVWIDLPASHRRLPLGLRVLVRFSKPL
jgi:HlyD family secretion protein